MNGKLVKQMRTGSGQASPSNSANSPIWIHSHYCGPRLSIQPPILTPPPSSIPVVLVICISSAAQSRFAAFSYATCGPLTLNMCTHIHMPTHMCTHAHGSASAYQWSLPTKLALLFQLQLCQCSPILLPLSHLFEKALQYSAVIAAIPRFSLELCTGTSTCALQDLLDN